MFINSSLSVFTEDLLTVGVASLVSPNCVYVSLFGESIIINIIVIAITCNVILPAIKAVVLTSV